MCKSAVKLCTCVTCLLNDDDGPVLAKFAVPGQVWYLIVLISDLCLPLYFYSFILVDYLWMKISTAGVCNNIVLDNGSKVHKYWPTKDLSIYATITNVKLAAI